MQKISLTGHSRGIGKGIVDLLSDDYEIIGFSRSNGYDISAESDRGRILEESSQCDIFINNAWYFEAQSLLFDMFYHRWYDDSSKTIININSTARYTKNNTRNPIYAKHKKDLYERSVERMMDFNRGCKIINVSPGFVDTEMISVAKEEFSLGEDDMLSPVQFAEYIKWLLNVPIGIEVCDFTVHKKKVLK